VLNTVCMLWHPQPNSTLRSRWNRFVEKEGGGLRGPRKEAGGHSGVSKYPYFLWQRRSSNIICTWRHRIAQNPTPNFGAECLKARRGDDLYPSAGQGRKASARKVRGEVVRIGCRRIPHNVIMSNFVRRDLEPVTPLMLTTGC
jgi:hypothetical protein